MNGWGVKLRCLAVALASLALGAPARADFDLPAILTFDFARSAEPFTSFSEVSSTSNLLAEAYLNTGASAFGESGVLIWARFMLPGPENLQAVLLLDLDLSLVDFSGQALLPAQALRASYLEKSGDQVVFQAGLREARISLTDVFFSGSDQDAVELKLDLLLEANSGHRGGRALVNGNLVTMPSPQEQRGRYLGPGYPQDSVYVDTGCSGDVYIPAEGCDCGGTEDDYAGSGCEGDSMESDGCAGDTTTGSSCESSGCAGDTSAGASCSDSSNCAIAGRKKTRWRALPQILAVGWIIALQVYRRRKNRVGPRLPN